ncbi:MAG: hypothetical protein LBE09_00665, partial [Christensenellaceae bacterium]|nr:hypothetical protein [Christensenellaceae bacterium]
TGKITLTKDIPTLFSFTIRATANNGVFAEYNFSQIDATSISIASIKRGDVPITWNGNTDSGSTYTTYTTAMAKPGDKLTVAVSFGGTPSFTNWQIVSGTGYTVSGNIITINPLTSHTSDKPKLTIKIQTTHNKTIRTATKAIYIYMPVEEISINALRYSASTKTFEVDRGFPMDIATCVSYNHGYATNKVFELSGFSTTGNAKGSNGTTKLDIIANTAGGTTFMFNIVTKDKLFTNYSVKVITLDVYAFELQYGKDDKNKIQVINQLENGTFVYVTPVYNADMYTALDFGNNAGIGEKVPLSLLGVSIDASVTYRTSGLMGKNRNGEYDGRIELDETGNDNIRRIRITFETYANNTDIQLLGNDNYLNYKVNLKDGTSTNGSKELTRRLDVFNGLDGSDKLTLSTGEKNKEEKPIVHDNTYFKINNDNKRTTYISYVISDVQLIGANYGLMSYDYDNNYLSFDFSKSNGSESGSITLTCIAYQDYNFTRVYNRINEKFKIVCGFVTGAGNLKELKNSQSNWYLKNDIDLSNYSNWTSIKDFNGIFQGNFHVIRNLKINIPGTEYLSDQNFGLFANLKSGASIHNLYLYDSQILCASGQHNGAGVNVGALAGINSGNIVGCTVRSYTPDSIYIDVDRATSNVGGLVGYNLGVIQGSVVSAQVQGVGNLGGIAGKNGGKIKSCPTYGKISLYPSFIVSVGGIVGWNSSGTIDNCISFMELEFRAKIKIEIRAGYTVGHNDYGTIIKISNFRGGTYYKYSLNKDIYMFKHENGQIGRQGGVVI